MPERYYRGDRDRDFGSADRNRSIIRREESPSERRNQTMGDRERRDRNDRYRDSHRGYSRYDDGRHRYYGREDHRNSDRNHGIRYDQDRHANDDDRHTRSGRGDYDVEGTGSSEMRMRRRRDNLDGRSSHYANRDNLKRERSEECESEPAKRRRDDGDISSTVRRHIEDSDREDNVRSIGDFNPRTSRRYDHYPREETGRSTGPNRRYSHDNDEARSDYAGRRDRAYSRRRRQDYETGNEEQSPRPSERRPSDISPPYEGRAGGYRSFGSPHKASMDVSPTRGTQKDDHLYRRHRIDSDDAGDGDVRGRENFFHDKGGGDNCRDAQMGKLHETSYGRPMHSARDDPHSGFRAREHKDRGRDENHRDFGGRNADHAKNGFRTVFGPREHYDHRFRGTRLPEGAHSDRRQPNRFDTPRPVVGRNSGGRYSGRFQQKNPYGVEGPTVVREVPTEEITLLKQAGFKPGSVVFDVWDVTTRNDKIPEIYKRIEAEMRQNGEIGSPANTETKKETQVKKLQVSSKSNTVVDIKGENMRGGNADEGLEKATKDNSESKVGARAKGDEMNIGREDEELSKGSQRNRESNAELGTEGDEMKNGNENNRKDMEICEEQPQDGNQNEKMEVAVRSEPNIEKKEKIYKEDVEE